MKNICLVAVEIRSTHNIGSIFRTADGFGAEVVLVGICPRPKGGKNDNRLPHIIDKADASIAKTALGAEKSVKWRYFEDIESAIDALRSENFKIIAIEQNNKSKDLKQLKTTDKTALLLGPEVEGLSDQIINKCDEIYEIPMTGVKESFNVAVTAGIALYQTSLT